MYIFTEKKILQALIKAKQRWVKIKVLLEKSPYKANNINNKTYNTLKENNINVSWSNSDNYSYNHSKLIIIDETFIISTWNLSYSSFTKNKDFYIFVKNNWLLKLIKNNYLNDYNWITNYQYSDKIIYSPLWTRIKFQKLLESAKQEIKIYFPYINDDIFLQQLIKISKEKNINIQIILDKKEKTNWNIIKLKNNGIKIFFFNKYKNHSKAILIDEEFLYIWSINCSKYSIEKNKEIWIIIKNKTIINQFKDIFINDTKKEK
jgi:phosphatidylserine/phosphatidylglycerophosphate/cardiolipin synthase-like enzyme